MNVLLLHGGTVENFALAALLDELVLHLAHRLRLGFHLGVAEAETDVEHQVAHWYLDFLMVDEVTSMAISIHHERSTL